MLFVYLASFCLSINTTYAQELISGSLSGTLTSDQYHVTGNIWVEEQNSLIIEAGSQFTFQGAYSFVIHGTLFCNGTYNAPVTFTDLGQNWLGITCTSTCDPATVFRYAVIENSSDVGLAILSCAPELYRCTIQYNLGAGLSINSSSGLLQVSSSLIRENSGRGIVVSGQSILIINDSTIRDNTGFIGAGISCFQSIIDLINVDLLDNSTSGFDQDGGGGIYASGSSLFLENCDVRGNSVYDDDDGASGGAIYAVGTTLAIESSVVENNSTEAWDLGGNGGAIFFDGGSLSIQGTDFIGNSSIGYQQGGAGGAIHVTDSSVELTGCRFFNNQASGEQAPGGAIYLNQAGFVDISDCQFSDNYTDVRGGAIYVNNTTGGNLTNLSMTNNESGDFGKAIYLYQSTVDLSSSLIAYHVGDAIHVGAASALTVEYCDFFGDQQTHISGIIPVGFGTIVQVNGNGDPCDVSFNIFLNPTLIDYPSYDLRLLPDSPCVDAGDPTLPTDPDGSIADIGAIALATQPMELALNPVQTMLDPDGGTIMYDVSLLSNVGTAFPALTYAEMITLPNGNTLPGFIRRITFPFAPYGNQTVEGFELTVPSFAPSGWYELNAYVGLSPGQVGDTDFISFYKPESNVPTRNLISASDFSTAGNIGDNSQTVTTESTQPTEFILHPPYPNPFNDRARIIIELPVRSNVIISAYNIHGQLVRTLHDGFLSAGQTSFDFTTQGLASGLYFVTAEIPGSSHQIQKLTVIK